MKTTKKIIKGVCTADAISGMDRFFSIPQSGATQALRYGITITGRLIAAFEGEDMAEFMIPGGSEDVAAEIGGRLADNMYHPDGLWVGGPVAAALADIARRGAPRLVIPSATSGTIRINPSEIMATFESLVEAANGPPTTEG